jgi:hypothetical protein
MCAEASDPARRRVGREEDRLKAGRPLRAPAARPITESLSPCPTGPSRHWLFLRGSRKARPQPISIWYHQQIPAIMREGIFFLRIFDTVSLRVRPALAECWHTPTRDRVTRECEPGSVPAQTETASDVASSQLRPNSSSWKKVCKSTVGWAFLLPLDALNERGAMTAHQFIKQRNAPAWCDAQARALADFDLVTFKDLPQGEKCVKGGGS